ncbi:HNH endonuclease [Terrihabitans sp. B22-R8]|uniref:HNH endonuclease n=1 Tax=Terrihabitans sp. B22-R8 TaxID=3425128 RepID=UPI00403C24D1
MARLSGLKSRLTAPPPLVGAPPPKDEAERSRKRDASAPWRKLYKTARWQKLRAAVLLRDHYTCQNPRCRRSAPSPQLVCDHVEPHRGDEVKFWAGPFQTLCKSCHDEGKQKEEQASLHTRGVWD